MKKFCKGCKTEKNISEYAINKREKNKRQYFCRECANQKQKEWYNNHKERHVKNVRKNHDKQQQLIRKFISKVKSFFGCKICGYNKCNECLDFHHLNPKEKEFTISIAINRKYSIKRIKEEMRKCILVCKNCHGELHNGLIEI